MQKLLLLGGTRFIGRNLLERLIPLNRFDITLFNRGITNPDLFPDLQRIQGDRYTDDLALIGKESWDYIIDLSCYFPKSIELVLQYLRHPPKRYVYLSSISVYQTPRSSFHEEDLMLQPCSEEQKVDPSNYSYGKRQAECDRLLLQAPFDYLILRPPIIYGPYDYTDRFYYWLYQAKTQAEILLPEWGERLQSLTYVEDLVDILLESLTLKNHRKIYNVISHPSISIRAIVEAASQQLGTDPKLFSGPADFLLAHQIAPMQDLPLWSKNDYYTYSGQKMRADFQSSFASFADKLRATIAYYEGLGWPVPQAGISIEKQQHLLEKIKKL